MADASFESLLAAEPGDLEKEAPPDDVRAQAARELAGRTRGAPGRQDIVHDQDPRPAGPCRRGGTRARPCRTPASYDSRTRSHGSLPGFRAGTNPAPRFVATAPPRMNPRASMPSTCVTSSSRNGSAMAPMTVAEQLPVGENRRDVLKDDPRFGVVRDRPERVEHVPSERGRRQSSDVEAPRDRETCLRPILSIHRLHHRATWSPTEYLFEAPEDRRIRG